MGQPPEAIERSLVSSLEQHRSALVLGDRALRIRHVPAGMGVADASSVYIVQDRYVLHLSPAEYPNVAADAVAHRAEARAALGDLGFVVPRVLVSGKFQGRSYMISPRYRPLSAGRLRGRWEWWRLRPRVLGWLRDVAARAVPTSDAAIARFHDAIDALATFPDLSKHLRDSADRAAKDLRSGALVPRFNVMHGDFWRGNILGSQEVPFVLIDWRGSLVEGFAIFDLIRCAESFRIGKRELRGELEAHARSLGVEPRQTETFLLAALGNLARDLGEFPAERFLNMAERCHRLLNEAIAD